MKSHFEIYLILSIVKMLFLLSTFNDWEISDMYDEFFLSKFIFSELKSKPKVSYFLLINNNNGKPT